MTDFDPIDAAFRRLRDAERAGTPGPPIRDLIDAGDDRSAYAVQHRLTAARLRRGARVTGRKIGLTSVERQRRLGCDEPAYGMLFDDMAVESGAIVDLSRLLQPRVEAQVAFVLAGDITDPCPNSASVRADVAYAVGALEVVDSRIARWDLRLCDLIADNGSSARYVVGDTYAPLAEVEPRTVEMALAVDGRAVAKGTGEEVLGDPLKALAWLAAAAVAEGDPLRAGEIVLAGALAPPITVAAGEHVRATFAGLGTVEATFVAKLR